MKLSFSKKNMWEALPPFAKSIAGHMLSIVPLPLLLGNTFKETASFINESQFWTKEQIEEFQLKKLKAVIETASQTAFYQKQWKEIGFEPGDFKQIKDLELLPTIDRDDIIQFGTEMYSGSPESASVDYVSTGGTSGSPIRFYIPSNRSGIEYAYLNAGWARRGYQLGMPKAVIRGTVIKKMQKQMFYEYDPLLRHHCYSNFHMTEEYMEKYIASIRSLKQCVLHVYPSSGETLARYMQSKNHKPFDNVVSILLESENVYPGQVKLMEEFFGARTQSSYGHSEKLVLATECEHSSLYHVWPTYGYCELIDENNKVVTEVGGKGEIVGTGFINTFMPFIRFRTGDYSTYAGDHCEQCGRSHMLLDGVEGRWPKGNLVATDGSNISMTALNLHDDALHNVKRYQFQQSTPGQCELLLMPNNSFDQSDIAKIDKNMKKRLGDRLAVTIKTVEDIPLTPAGKHLLVVQK